MSEHVTHYGAVRFQIVERDGVTTVEALIECPELASYDPQGGAGVSLPALLASQVFKEFKDGSLIARTGENFGINLSDVKPKDGV